MKKRIIICFSAGLTLSFISCMSSPGADFSKDDREKLMKLHNDISSPMREHPENINCDAMVNAHYAEDAISMPPNMPPLVGKAAILAMCKSAPSFKKFDVKDLEVEGSGNLAYIRGTYNETVKVNDTTDVNDKGNYLEIWKKDAKGDWKCIRDMFNSDKPVGQ